MVFATESLGLYTRWYHLVSYSQFQSKDPQSYPTRASSCRSTRRHSTSFPIWTDFLIRRFPVEYDCCWSFYRALEVIVVTVCHVFFLSKPAMSWIHQTVPEHLFIMLSCFQSSYDCNESKCRLQLVSRLNLHFHLQNLLDSWLVLESFFLQLWPSILGQLYGFLSSPLDSKASRTWSIDLKKSLMREREPYLFPACCDHCCWCVDGASVFVNITLLPAIVYPAPIGNEWPAAPALHAQLEAGWTAVPFIRFFSSLCFHWVRRSFMGFAVLCCTCSVFIGSTSIPVQMALLPIAHAVTLNLCYCGNNR